MPYLLVFPGGGGEIIGRPGRQPEAPPRGKILGGLSERARRRLAFRASTAPAPWVFMLTLTFGEPVAVPKQRFALAFDRIKRAFGRKTQWLWIMEWTKRGREHFHVFFGEFERSLPSRLEIVGRGRRRRTVVRGEPEEAAIRAWRAFAPRWTDAHERFNRGGILELLGKPDAAGRYVAKDGAKRAQKQCAPEFNSGRCWASSYRPRPIRRIRIPGCVALPPWSLLWDASELEAQIAAAPAEPAWTRVRRPGGGVYAVGGRGAAVDLREPTLSAGSPSTTKKPNPLHV